MPGYRHAATIHAHHLMFLANLRDEQVAISVHSWKPISKALGVLHAVVGSTGLSEEAA